MAGQVEERLRELAQKLRKQRDPHLWELARRIEEFLQHPQKQVRHSESRFYQTIREKIDTPAGAYHIHSTHTLASREKGTVSGPTTIDHPSLGPITWWISNAQKATYILTENAALLATRGSIKEVDVAHPAREPIPYRTPDEDLLVHIPHKNREPGDVMAVIHVEREGETVKTTIISRKPTEERKQPWHRRIPRRLLRRTR